jgi:hypothetical protein
MYCLFCNVPCIVCVYMCTEQLPPGGYPIAVKYIISYHKAHFHSFFCFLLDLTSSCLISNVTNIIKAPLRSTNIISNTTIISFYN